LDKRFSWLLSFWVGVMIMSGCGYPWAQTIENEGPAATAAVQFTSVAQTVEALESKLATREGTNTPYVITTTPLPTYTPQPTYTPVPVSITQTPAVGASDCDAATFINDMTVPSGTVFGPAISFVKTWRVVNSGTCTWTTAYTVIFDRGESFGAPAVINLPHAVSPGQSVDITTNMITPKVGGKYEGFWSLKNASGTIFGFGPKHNQPFDLSIVVTTTTPDVFAVVTHVGMSVSPDSAEADCPPGKKFTFTANIEANSAGEVRYHWEFSDDRSTDTESVVFSKSGDKTVSTTWTLGDEEEVSPNPYDGWARIYIDEPNHQEFPEIDFSMTCK
jgi:hypothetical protein